MAAGCLYAGPKMHCLQKHQGSQLFLTFSTSDKAALQLCEPGGALVATGDDLYLAAP